MKNNFSHRISRRAREIAKDNAAGENVQLDSTGSPADALAPTLLGSWAGCWKPHHSFPRGS